MRRVEPLRGQAIAKRMRISWLVWPFPFFCSSIVENCDIPILQGKIVVVSGLTENFDVC
jgi:hypothetical protein